MDYTNERDLIDLGRELLATVGSEADGNVEVRTERIVSAAQVPVVHGLSTHALRLGSAALDLWEDRLHLEAMPLIRTVYESAVTAMWAVDSKEAVFALMNEHNRQRRALIRTMEKSALSAFRNATGEASIDDDVMGASLDSSAQARLFEQRCLALDGIGVDGYAIYRMMCGSVHPSMDLMDKYVSPQDDSEFGLALVREPERFQDSTWLYMNVIAMMWAARAFDVMRKDHPHRNYLRGVAKRLGTTVDIARLSPAAVAAEEKADRERRRAAYKPRRGR